MTSYGKVDTIGTLGTYLYSNSYAANSYPDIPLSVHTLRLTLGGLTWHVICLGRRSGIYWHACCLLG